MPGRFRQVLCRHTGLLRGLAALLLVLAAVLFVRALPALQAVEWLTARVNSLGAWGPTLFGVAYVLLTLLMLPGTPITIAAGVVFGPLVGAALIIAAAMVSATLSFVVARYVAHDRVARLIRHYPRVAAVYRALGKAGGWKIVAALRLSHAMPFGLQNILFGLTPIPFRPFFLASLVSLLPGTLLWLYLGYLGAAALEPGTGGDGAGVNPWVTRGLVLLAAGVALFYVAHAARRAIKDATGVDLENATTPAPAAGAALACWPWSTLTLLAVSLVLLAVAVWSYVERSRVKQTVERWLTSDVPAAGSGWPGACPGQRHS